MDAKARWTWMQRWRTTYAQSVKSATGKWTYNGFDWHAFSWNFSRSLSRHKARSSYFSEQVTGLVAIPESETQLACLSRSIQAPNLAPLGDDIYVFPEDLSWTMCFTHEEGSGIGPFYSRAQWQ
jgi:hypothetical protein